MRLATPAAILVLALRTATLLGAQSPSSACQAAGSAPSAASPAIIPIDVANNHVYVKVCVADRPLEFILDTGAGQTFLDLNTAKKLGVPLGAAFTARGAGAGTIAAAQVNGATVVLQGSTIAQSISAALDLSALPAREGHAMDGILGYDFIAKHVLAVDYVKSELRLYDRSTFRYDGTGSSLPITFINNHPHVDGDIRLADGAVLHGRFIIDVGSSLGLSLAKPFVEENRLRDRVGPTLHRRAGGGVGGVTMADIGRVAGLRLGAAELLAPITNLYGDSAGVFSERGPWVGNIGGEILRRFTVYFDYSAKRLILEPNASLGEAFEADMSGLGFIVNTPTEWAVDYVVPATPATEAGLEPGDIVLSVDGRPIGQSTLLETRKRFRRAGERIVFEVRRGGAKKSLTLVTRRLV